MGIHAAGILISQAIYRYSATFLPPKVPHHPFDMVVAEDIGLYKFDIISQRGQKIKIPGGGALQPSAGGPHDIHDIGLQADPNADLPATPRLLVVLCGVACHADAAAQTQVDNYLGLVAASSVIRPGWHKAA